MIDYIFPIVLIVIIVLQQYLITVQRKHSEALSLRMHKYLDEFDTAVSDINLRVDAYMELQRLAHSYAVLLDGKPMLTDLSYEHAIEAEKFATRETGTQHTIAPFNGRKV